VGKQDHGDAQGHPGGHRPCDPVLAAAYGYEITARLRDQGFSDIAEEPSTPCSSGWSRRALST